MGFGVGSGFGVGLGSGVGEGLGFRPGSPSCAPSRLAAVALPSSAATPCLYWCRLPLSLPTVAEEASAHTASCAETLLRVSGRVRLKVRMQSYG